MSGVALIVIAKAPVPGRCKTRLSPPCSPVQATALAQAALEDTLATVARAPSGRRVLALEGEPGPWVPPAFEVVPQVPGGLGERLAGAFDAVGGPALLIGMDTPQVTRTSLAFAAATLEHAGVDAVLGGTPDGGYWTIGLRRPDPRVFEDVPMSSARTARAQRMRLHALGLRWRQLEPLRDVDTIDDACAVAAIAPRSRFARVLSGLALDFERARTA